MSNILYDSYSTVLTSSSMMLVLQHIRKYLQDLLSLISEFWSAFTLPAPARPGPGYPVSVASSLVLEKYLGL